MDGQNRAVHGASLLILLQVGSRAVTFVANQVLLRFLTAQLLGIATQLEVYYLSVLFFARESLRVAIQRQGSGDHATQDEKSGKIGDENAAIRTRRSTQAAVNLGYLSILLGVLVALAFGWLYQSSLSAETRAAAPYLERSLVIYGMAAIVELLAEPAFVVMQIRLQFGTRALAEGVATFLRCGVTLGSAVWAARQGYDIGVLPFALGQMSYGLGLWGVYGWYGLRLARLEGFSLFLRSVEPVSIEAKGKVDSERFVLGRFYQPTLQLASSMMAQSVVKHVLTQGDTFLVSILSTPTAQGVYALANNYGGLAARLVFQPVEESSRNYFSRLLSDPNTRPRDSDKAGPEPSVQKASTDLQTQLKIYVMLSLVVVTIGPSAGPLLLSLVAGRRWASSGAGECLAAYMWYIPLLAINGVAEAFVSSVATESEVHRQSAWMTAFSLGFAGAGFVFMRLLDWGAIGLVMANSINMLCRIVWCASFISAYFSRAKVPFDIAALRPGPLTFLAAVVTSQATRRVITMSSSQAPDAREAIVDLVKIVVTALPFLGILLFSERQFLLQGYRAIARKASRAA